MANIDQRKYLKKYLDDDDVKRHKKKSREHSSSRSESHRVRIVDDDGEYKPSRKYDDDSDFMLTGEDAPQVVGIVDDRPPELRAVEDFRNSNKWRSLEVSSNRSSRPGNKLDGNSQRYTERRRSRSRSPVKRDYSPPRRPDRRDTSQASGARKRRSSDDYSPVRRKPEGESRYREVSGDSDLSPVRRRNKDNDDDLSPVRKNQKLVSDQKDLSPVQRRKLDGNREQSIAHGSEQKDLSPVRKRKTTISDDQSPVRRRKRSESPSNRTEEKSSNRKTRFNNLEDNVRRPEDKIKDRKSRFDSPDDESKMNKTLDGKRAGLQDAKMLKKETQDFRRREDELFKKMSNDLSGRNADVVVRDKKSGRVRDLEQDRAKDEEKQQRDKERQEIYNKWGKGLKQVEDYRNKVAEEEYESNKPLARYSDDSDLDKMLRDQERDGDPMLAYMRQKNVKSSSNTPKVPTYNGPFPDNRFNIRPGYRWDGVDRSNGYEKKWLTVQNQKVATREEAYKYSTEDM